MNRQTYIRLTIILTLTLAAVTLFACGGGEPEAAAGPTPTQARRLAATPLSTHVFGQPTTIIKTDAAEATNTPEAAAVDLSRGERIYGNQNCGDCHGAQGEGVEGKGSPLAGLSLTETEFADILRTGGQGTLGNDHLYGPQAISPSGMEALYTYVQSFQP